MMIKLQANGVELTRYHPFTQMYLAIGNISPTDEIMAFLGQPAFVGRLTVFG